MGPIHSRWALMSRALFLLWLIGSLYLSVTYLAMLGWAWPNFRNTAYWTQGLAWAVVAAPLVGLALAIVFAVTKRGPIFAAVLAGLVIQLLALVATVLVNLICP